MTDFEQRYIAARKADDHTRKMLAYCVEAMNLSKSELIRLCIAKEYKELLEDSLK